MHLAKKIAIVATFVFSTSGISNPTGEIVEYKLDTSPSRTSSLVSSGAVKIEVLEHLEEGRKGPSFNNRCEYEFMVRYMGVKSGVQNQEVVEELFSSDFAQLVKEAGTLRTRQFRAQYLGEQDISGPNGESFPASQIILLDDFQDNMQSVFHEALNLVGQAIQNQIGHNSETKSLQYVEDLKVKLTLHPDVQAFYAAKIDASALYNGIAVKMGFDLLK